MERLIVPTNEILFGVLKDGTVINSASADKKPLEAFLRVFESIAKWLREADEKDVLYYGLAKMVTHGEFQSALQYRADQAQKQL